MQIYISHACNLLSDRRRLSLLTLSNLYYRILFLVCGVKWIKLLVTAVGERILNIFKSN